MWKVDSVYYFCLSCLRLSVLAHQRGECSEQAVDEMGTATIIEVRKLYEQNLYSLLRLPEA